LAPSLDFTIALIPIAPFLAAFLAPWVHKFTGQYAGWILAIIPASVFVYLLNFIQLIASGSFVSTALEWVPSYGLNFSFFLDGLSLTFALLISGIGTIIVIYSGKYLKGHKHQGRFLAFILMFMGSMLGLVLADNMVVLFIFWELTSITSFLLIGFDHARQASRRAAIQALVVTGGGGLALLVGVILLQQVLGVWELSALRNYGQILQEQAIFPVILILFILAAFTKSAQFPFHFWLPNAMEAPTPVSAFLHSATMVKAGVYLLARMNPVLGANEIWTITLVAFGSITLLWGATWALRQSDMKQMLAQTTVASLGLLVILIGIGTDIAIAAMVIYLIAHALYKATLFLVAGIIDHGTGTREITELGGMMKLMPLTFIVAAVAAISMAGFPPAVGFFAKEEMYLALAQMEWHTIAVLIVLILGNAMMLVVGAAIAIKPFFGGLKATSIKPHDGSLALIIGPVIFGVAALSAGVFVKEFGDIFISPTASAIYNLEVENHLKWYLGMFLKPIILLSVLTWVIGGLLFWKFDEVRKILRRVDESFKWDFDIGFDWLMFGLIRFADKVTRIWHHGRLEIYMIVVFISLGVASILPLILTNSLPPVPDMPDLTFYEWGVFVMAVAGLVSVLLAKTRLVAIVSLGIQGFAVALIFLLFGAPDLAFTQFMVETLTVVILALVMTRLYLDKRDRRRFEDILRDGGLAVICGVGLMVLLMAVLQTPIDLRLSEFFAATSVPIAHGHNIVNVILVDYRGLDTFGEIAVVMAAGVSILALIRIRAGGPQTGIGAPKKSARKNITRKTTTRKKPAVKKQVSKAVAAKVATKVAVRAKAVEKNVSQKSAKTKAASKAKVVSKTKTVSKAKVASKPKTASKPKVAGKVKTKGKTKAKKGVAK